MKRLLFLPFNLPGRSVSWLMVLLVVSVLKVSGQDLPAEPKSMIESAMTNWNAAYGTNVKATGWSYEGVITNDAKLKQVINEIILPANAWMPDGDYMKPNEMIAKRVADVPSISKQQITDWGNKIKAMIKTGHHLVRVKWMKGGESFTSLCITDNNTIVYDNMFSNAPLVDHHSTCMDYRIGWIWQRNFANMTRGRITADLFVRCINGVAGCTNSCIATMTLGDAKIFCVVTTAGPCCTLTWSYGWATAFGTVTISPTGVVTIVQPLGSSGSGTGSCTACCPPFGTGYAIPATPGNPSGRFVEDVDSMPPRVSRISVKTISGEVVDVRVPNNIQPGDKITGSVEVKTTSSSLQGVVIDLNNHKSDIAGKLFSLIVPFGGSAIPFIIKDKDGHTVGTAEIPVSHAIDLPPGVTISEEQILTIPQHAPGNFVPATYCHPGQPMTIEGFFDGNAGNTTVSLNNIPCEIIAESPRGCFIQTPSDLSAGQTTIKISDGNETKSMPVQVVTINLSANKTAVQKGTSATVTATVNGLENLNLDRDHFKIELENGSPTVIQFQNTGTTTLIREINSSNVKNGSFSFTTKIRGITTGGYTISSQLTAAADIDCKNKFDECVKQCEEVEKKCMNECYKKEYRDEGCLMSCLLSTMACKIICYGEYMKCMEKNKPK